MSSFYNVRVMLVQMLLVSSLLLFTITSAQSHEVSPTVADLSVADGKIVLNLRITLESFIAGIDLDEAVDTDDIPEAAAYEALRALNPSALDERTRAFAPEMLDAVSLVVDGDRIPLQINALDIPDVEDLELPRTSQMELSGVISGNAKTAQLVWPKGYGPLLLRQIGPEEPFTGFLTGGAASPEISIETVRDGFFSGIARYLSSWF